MARYFRFIALAIGAIALASAGCKSCQSCRGEQTTQIPTRIETMASAEKSDAKVQPIQLASASVAAPGGSCNT